MSAARPGGTDGARGGRRIRLTIGPAAWTFAFAAVIGAFVVHDLAVRARQPLGWALAAVVAAAALEVPVDAVDATGQAARPRLACSC